jgi:NAD(P)-dependent dehydrogenase (short-subunit alcohol dehydrogenase family)
MLLENKVLLISNVTRFAGRGTTAVALREGARVVAHDPSFTDAGARARFEAECPGAHATAAQASHDIAQAALDRHGRIDALVNNDAYPAVRAALAEAQLAKLREAFEIMVVRPFELTQKVVPIMRAQGGGRIVFVSSAAPLRGIANYSQYVSVRSAVIGLVNSLARECGRDAITVNAVGSNYVENPDYFPPALLADKAAMAKMTSQIPLGRLGKPEELASAVCFLCSDGAGFITGHLLPHAGGWA